MAALLAGSNPDPPRIIKNTRLNGGYQIRQADNLIASPPCKIARWATGVFPPFCSGSNGFIRRFKSGPAPKLKEGTRHFGGFPFLMGRITGFEPATPGTTNQCSNQLSYIRHTGGADRTRTDDPLHAMQVLYQLSYNPLRRHILYFFLPNVKSIC